MSDKSLLLSESFADICSSPHCRDPKVVHRVIPLCEVSGYLAPGGSIWMSLLVSNIRSVAVHPFCQLLRSFPYVDPSTSFTSNHINHIGRDAGKFITRDGVATRTTNISVLVGMLTGFTSWSVAWKCSSDVISLIFCDSSFTN